MSSNIFIKRVCYNCHSEFTARTTVTKYCSEKCAKKAYKLRLKKVKIDASEIETEIIKKRIVEPLKEKEFLSIIEVSKLVGVSRTTLWRVVKKGDLKMTKIGTRIIFKKTEIDKLFN